MRIYRDQCKIFINYEYQQVKINTLWLGYIQQQWLKLNSNRWERQGEMSASCARERVTYIQHWLQSNLVTYQDILTGTETSRNIIMVESSFISEYTKVFQTKFIKNNLSLQCQLLTLDLFFYFSLLSHLTRNN